MLPELFRIGPIPVRSYGVMMALAFLFGVWYVKRMTARDGKPFDPYLNVAYIMIFGGVIGARLAYVFMHWSDFAHNLLSAFNPFHEGQFGIAGLNLYGGVLLALIGSFLYIRYKKMSVLEVFDYFAPALALGIGIGRIGCFLNGCCFGTPCDLPWAISFPKGSIPYSVFGSAHIHPSQLYTSLYGFGLFIALHFLLKHRRFIGQLTAVMLMAEAVFRFAIEFVRYYENAMMFSFLGHEATYNQVIAALLFLLGLILYIVNRSRQPHRASV